MSTFDLFVTHIRADKDAVYDKNRRFLNKPPEMKQARKFVSDAWKKKNLCIKKFGTLDFVHILFLKDTPYTTQFIELVYEAIREAAYMNAKQKEKMLQCIHFDAESLRAISGLLLIEADHVLCQSPDVRRLVNDALESNMPVIAFQYRTRAKNLYYTNCLPKPKPQFLIE